VKNEKCVTLAVSLRYGHDQFVARYGLLAVNEVNRKRPDPCNALVFANARTVYEMLWTEKNLISSKFFFIRLLTFYHRLSSLCSHFRIDILNCIVQNRLISSSNI